MDQLSASSSSSGTPTANFQEDVTTSHQQVKIQPVPNQHNVDALPVPTDHTHVLVETKSLSQVADANNKYAELLRQVSSTAIPITQKVTTKSREIARAQHKSLHSLRISFSEMHSAEAALYFTQQQKACSISIMNFANGEHPGGGYVPGARAQEEALCRQFPLYYPSLLQAQKNKLYPFGCCCGISDVRYSDVLITHGIECLRGDPSARHKRLGSEKRFKANFIAAAAPCWEKGDRAKLVEAIENVIWAPFCGELQEIGHKHVLILGAWGCGAFGNDPTEMAANFVEALRRHHIDGCPYSDVHFAVPSFKALDNKNVAAFRDALSTFCIETLGYQIDIKGRGAGRTARCGSDEGEASGAQYEGADGCTGWVGRWVGMV
eukprot:CAMPEP_0197855762 /NCGR_PEP_ID=MMETSP1438-20131217/27242_1 /TAXON_ID=1461541 /ORGANISM="Pterosperma sp., Strain CCMP1384" /LENGTH=377 /DNA_ID=CAMNT_0043470993 /DNA_START=154 /DNA_END=1287 /DNA_ORIENTATION=-